MFAIQKTCLDPYKNGLNFFKDEYDCMLFGYQELQNKITEMGEKMSIST